MTTKPRIPLTIVALVLVSLTRPAAAEVVDDAVSESEAAGHVAARLAEDPQRRILVLEAGPMDRSLYMLRMPAALAEPLKSERYNWNYFSEPEPYLDNRKVNYPRGRVVGGSSSINGMVYDHSGSAVNGMDIKLGGGGAAKSNYSGRFSFSGIKAGERDFTASMDKYMDDTETVSVVADDITQQDFYLGAGWLEFDPESLEVTMMMGDAPLTETLTISNLGDADAIIEISEKDEGYLPPLHIPAFTGTLPEDTRPVSMGPAPDAKPMPLSAAGALRNLLAGEPATAIDIYPGENLVHIPDTTVPGYWDIVGSVGGTQFFAGDFTGGDFSTLYVADYGNNNLYAVDTATAVYTLIGPTTPPAGQTFSGLTGTPDGMLYGLTTSCSSSSGSG